MFSFIIKPYDFWYSMESDDQEMTPPRAAPPRKLNLKSQVAKKVEKLRNNGHTDKDIIDKLIESDGITINNTEIISKTLVKPTFTSSPNSLTIRLPI